MRPEDVWDRLQARYRIAYERLCEEKALLDSKYGEGNACFARKSEREHVVVRRRVVDRIAQLMLRWLDANSPWGWESGTSLHWICAELTAEMALSIEPPTLPSESAAFGYPAVARTTQLRHS